MNFQDISANIFEGLEHFLEHTQNITPKEFEDNFNVFVSDSTEECSICKDVMNEYVKIPECKHKFHKTCLQKWIFDSNRCKTDCPICRTEIKTSRTTDEDKRIIREKYQEILDSVDVARRAFGEISSRLRF